VYILDIGALCMTTSIQNQILSIELSSSLEALIDKVKKSLSGSKSVAMSQAWGILQIAIAETIKIIETSNPSLKGSNKKTIALAMLSMFYDKVFLVVTVPYVPVVLQPIISKYTKALLMLLVSSAIDSMVEIFRKSGIFTDPNSVPEVSDK
jgi:hypothetical protein